MIYNTPSDHLNAKYQEDIEKEAMCPVRLCIGDVIDDGCLNEMSKSCYPRGASYWVSNVGSLILATLAVNGIFKYYN